MCVQLVDGSLIALLLVSDHHSWEATLDVYLQENFHRNVSWTHKSAPLLPPGELYPQRQLDPQGGAAVLYIDVAPHRSVA